MKKPFKHSLPYVLVIASLVSQNGIAHTVMSSGQTAQPVPTPAGNGQPPVDHAAMGHGTPATAGTQGTQSTMPVQQDKAQQGAPAHAGHAMPEKPMGAAASAATGSKQAAPEAQHSQHQDPGNTQGRPATSAQTTPVQEQKAASQSSGMDHAAMGHAPTAATMPAPSHAGMSHPAQEQAVQDDSAGEQGMQMGRMQGGPPPADARDPSAYNEGAKFAHLGNHEMNDNAPFWRVLFDKAEAAKGDGERGQSVELEAWYGNDYNKAWVKVEGERSGGSLEAARTELLWDRAFATFWSTQLGIRHDSGQGESRNWLAFGVQGLAPYWFETEATAYWRPGSGWAARLSAKYEVLFSSRLILEPEVEANLYSRSDPERETGSGLSDIGAGLRLRYEVTRQFAPYIGVTWNRQFGRTADFTRMRGGDSSVMQAVAGVRFWF